MRRLAIAAVMWGCAVQASAAPEWLAVPGAPEIRVNLGALEQDRHLVTAWVRFSGSSRVLRGTAFEPGGKLPPHHQRQVLAQVDCQRRTVRALGTEAYDVKGRPVYMASVPGQAMPLPADEGLAWLYDALCEVARARSQ